MTLLDYLMIYALVCIWGLLTVNIILTIAGYSYYVETERKGVPDLKRYPKVSIMVPAHNEGVVIVQTVRALLNFSYPKEQYEIIVINDNSTDNSAELLAEIQAEHKDRSLTIVNTDSVTGGKGKSNALNIGYTHATGEYIVIYDADNTPDPNALTYLVAEIENDDTLGAVIGKFRTRNRTVNMLTRFINIETLAFQWMAQAGRWRLFKLCTIPGTNFILRRSIIDAIGGWDVNAIAEDTEISFRIYMMGYRIKMQPHAVTWEQEPQTVSVWFRQRTRWVMGNIYVLIKNLKLLFDPKARRIRFDILYFLSIYFLLLSALVISDVVFVGTLVGWAHTTLAGFSLALWGMALVLYVAGTYITITTEKGEMDLRNLGYIVIMYFVYSKMWMIVAFVGLVKYLYDRIFHVKATWYKTERFNG